MSVTRLAVFIENKSGRLAALTHILGTAGVNIRGFSIADTADYGILRLLVDKQQVAREALRANGFMVHESQVILAEVADRPGGLAEVLDAFADLKINVEYTYPTTHLLVAFGVDEHERGEQELRRRGVRLLADEDLGKL